MSVSIATGTEGQPCNGFDEADESGLEKEREDPNEEITKPFDPDQIKIRTQHIVVAQLVERIRHDEIDLQPDFQRLHGIWSLDRKSRLIESLLLRIPIPVFYVADKSDTWWVIDGVQRMSTINDFVRGKFSLQRLQYLTQLHKHQYGDLARPFQRRISETQLIVNVIEEGTPEEVMFNIFLRINTGGLMLNGQEIRHALNPGPVRDYLKNLAQTSEFTEATGNSIQPNRMADRESVLRFLAFYIDPPEEYAVSDLDGYLGKAMQKINQMSPAERGGNESDFRKAMRAAHEIFGENAFRKPPGESNRRRPISKALFEAWSVPLASCSSREIDSLIERRALVEQRFGRLLSEDSEFDNAISYGTSSPWRVHKRFQSVRKIVEEFI